MCCVVHSFQSEHRALNNIIGVAHEFQWHTDQSHCQVHHKLNTQHAGTITNITDTFHAEDEDIPALITTTAIECMTDQQKLCDLFKESAMTMKWHTCNPDGCLCLSQHKFALEDAAATANACLRIKININGLHFKPNFATNNVNHLSDEPFNFAPETPTFDTTPQSPITPEQMIQTFLDRLSGTRPPESVDTNDAIGSNQTQDTGSMINPDNLPADVGACCIQGQQHTISFSQSKTESPSGLLTVLGTTALLTTSQMVHTDSSINLGTSATSPSGTKSSGKPSHLALLNHLPSHTPLQTFMTGTWSFMHMLEHVSFVPTTASTFVH